MKKTLKKKNLSKKKDINLNDYDDLIKKKALELFNNHILLNKKLVFKYKNGNRNIVKHISLPLLSSRSEWREITNDFFNYIDANNSMTIKNILDFKQRFEYFYRKFEFEYFNTNLDFYVKKLVENDEWDSINVLVDDFFHKSLWYLCKDITSNNNAITQNIRNYEYNDEYQPPNKLFVPIIEFDFYEKERSKLPDNFSHTNPIFDIYT